MPEIFLYDFMIRAFIAGLIISIIAPVIGCFLVVRRYSLMADTLAHVSLVGVAVGLLSKMNPLMTAVITSAISAFTIEKLRNTKKIFGESVLALFLSGSLAVATILVSLANGFNANLLSYLFGSITTVTWADLRLIAGLGLVILLLVYFLYKELFFVSFDDELAQVNGINAKGFNLLLIILAAVTVSLAMTIVGVLLIGALMVIPVISAMQLGKSFKQTLFFSLIISITSVISGLFLAYYGNLASGGSIVLVSLGFFIISFLIARKKEG